MPQKYYGDLSDEEKINLFLSNDVFVFPHKDPEVAVDYCGMSGTIPLSQYFDIVNNSTITLYFKVETTVLSGNASAWSDLTEELGSVNAGGKAIKEWTPERSVPTSKVTESLRVYIRAYKQSDYTDLYGEDYVDFNYYFFDHTQGTLLHFGDFETDMDGWSGSYFSRSTAYPYTGAYGIYLNRSALDHSYNNRTTDSSGQYIPNKSYKLSKSYSGSAYSEVFIVFHLTYTKSNPASDKGVYDVDPLIRVWTDTSDSIIRVKQTRNSYLPRRVALKIPAEDGTVNWATLFQTWKDSNYYYYYYTHVDTIIIVGFS